MSFDPTTFLLEIVNFLVLLWLLRRFLFRPLQAALAARAAAEQQARAQLDRERAALAAQQATLEQARQQREQAAEQARQALAAELAAQRRQRLDALAQELADERAKASARLEAALAQRREAAGRALDAQAAEHVARYLQRLASPTLEAALVELFLDDLAALAPPQRAELQATGAGPVDCSSAFGLPEPLRRRVEQALAPLLGDAPLHWQIDPALIAGLAVHLPGHLLETSLRRGVDAFATGR